MFAVAGIFAGALAFAAPPTAPPGSPTAPAPSASGDAPAPILRDAPDLSPCDVKRLAAHLGIPAADVPAAMEALRSKSGVGAFQSTLAAAAAAATACAFAEAGYARVDAAYLAAYWGIWPLEAVQRAEGHLTNGQGAGLNDILASFRDERWQSVVVDADPDRFGRRAFYESGFVPCDARRAGLAWDTTPEAAAVRIGEAVAVGDKVERQLAEDAMREGAARLQREGATCSAIEADLWPEDLACLARTWRTTTAEAEQRAALAISRGRRDEVKRALEGCR